MFMKTDDVELSNYCIGRWHLWNCSEMTALDLTDEDWLGTDIALANVEDLLMIYFITKLVSDL